MSSPLREHFLLDPDVVFLNHGSFGACPIPVFEEYQRWQRVLERQPVKMLGRDVDGLLREAMIPLAKYLHADPADCVFVPNATTGVNLVARSLTLQAGDEVLTTDHEYGACDYTWDYVCREAGAHYRRVPIALPVDTAEAFIEFVWSGVTERTRVLFISHITSPTGLVFPIAPLVARARAAGILTVVDGAHAPGQIPLDLAALDPRLLHRQLPQVAMCAERLGCSVCPSRATGRPDSDGHQLGLARSGFWPADGAAGHPRPRRVSGDAGRPRLPAGA